MNHATASHTPSWERSVAHDDGARMSLVAASLVTLGRYLVRNHPAGGEVAGGAEAKYREFFELLPAARDVRDKVVVEIGGGLAELSKYFASQGASRVFCVEPNPEWHAKATEACRGQGNIDVLKAFGQNLPIPDRSVDNVIMHDVMEHVEEPDAVLAEAFRILRPGGILFVYFMPFFAPFGGHTWSFFPVPWAHLFYGRKVLAEMRSHVSGWHTTRLGETGLYRMSLRDFERCIHRSRFSVADMRLVGLKGQAWLTKMPLVRETCTMIVAARLSRDPRSS